MKNQDKYGWDTPPNNIAINYINACKLFTENEDEFNNFRQHPDYKIILEGYNDGGPMWLNYILLNYGDTLLKEKLSLFKRNDIYGNPTIRNIEGIGEICPFTLKYIGNAFDIKKEVKDFKLKKIVEVGGGFGSLSIMLDSIYDFDEYVLIDLPEVINLCKKYLINFPELFKKITFISTMEFDNIDKIENIDLFISDSSMAECDNVTQMIYFNKLIKNCKFGYIVYNTLHLNDSRNNFEILNNKLKENFIIKIEDRDNRFMFLTKKNI